MNASDPYFHDLNILKRDAAASRYQQQRDNVPKCEYIDARDVLGFVHPSNSFEYKLRGHEASLSEG